MFESVVKYFDAFLSLIPLSFVLGFYVSYVASRWWQQFLAIPWPDKLFHTVACYIPGGGDGDGDGAAAQNEHMSVDDV